MARVRACEEINDLILRSRAKHGVSKDGRESVPCVHPSRRPPIEIGCCRFRRFWLPKSGKPDFGGRPPYTKVKNKILPMSRIGEQTFVRSGRPRRWATQDEVRGFD